MENRYTDIEPTGSNVNEPNKTKIGLTPRELIKYHMNNPDEPISDADIENLVLDTNPTPVDENAPINTTSGAADNRMLSDKEIEQVKHNSITSPYDILNE